MSGLSTLFYWSVCLFFCYYHAVFIIATLYYNLKSGSVIPPTSFFFLRIALAIHSLMFPYKSDDGSISFKKCHWDFEGHCVKSHTNAQQTCEKIKSKPQ